MTHLLRTEWLKMRGYKAFWWMTAIIALSYPGVNYIFYRIYSEVVSQGGTKAQMVKMLIGTPFTFPEVWHTVAYASSLFIFIPAIAVIMFITNEYTFKTHRQNIIDGWSRQQFLTSKLIDVALVALLTTMLYTLVALIIGFVNRGENTANIWEQSNYIALFSLQAFSQLSIAFLIAFLTRKAFVALGIFVFYYVIVDPLFSGYAKVKLNDIGRFMPLEISDRLIPVPAFLGRIQEESYNKALAAVQTHVWLTLILTTLIWVLCFWINKKRDL